MTLGPTKYFDHEKGILSILIGHAAIDPAYRGL
jgi:hypothetical protein